MIRSDGGNDHCLDFDMYLRKKGNSYDSVRIHWECAYENRTWINLVDETYLFTDLTGVVQASRDPLITFYTINSSGHESIGIDVPEYTMFDKITLKTDASQKIAFIRGDCFEDPDVEPSAVGVAYMETDRQCDTFVQTVSSIGDNKYWAGRVYEGSDYRVECDTPLSWNSSFSALKKCEYESDYRPFGGAIPPRPVQNPYEWDADANEDGIQPIPYLFEDEIYSLGQPRSGQIYSIDNLKSLYAESYSIWHWNPASYRYEQKNGICLGNGEPCQVDGDCPGLNCVGMLWAPPTNRCGGGVRPVNNTTVPPTPDIPAEYCGIEPDIGNILIDNIPSGNVIINKSDYANLTYTSKVDSQQLPLVKIDIDWGDGTHSIISGVEMHDKPNPESPHSMYHLYSYWDLKNKDNSNESIYNDIDCQTAGECKVRVGIQVKDNWGWCSRGSTSVFQCPTEDYIEYDGWLVVREN